MIGAAGMFRHHHVVQRAHARQDRVERIWQGNVGERGNERREHRLSGDLQRAHFLQRRLDRGRRERRIGDVAHRRVWQRRGDLGPVDCGRVVGWNADADRRHASDRVERLLRRRGREVRRPVDDAFDGVNGLFLYALGWI
jgi:hypothetical protein